MIYLYDSWGTVTGLPFKSLSQAKEWAPIYKVAPDHEVYTVICL